MGASRGVEERAPDRQTSSEWGERGGTDRGEPVGVTGWALVLGGGWGVGYLLRRCPDTPEGIHRPISRVANRNFNENGQIDSKGTGSRSQPRTPCLLTTGHFCREVGSQVPYKRKCTNTKGFSHVTQFTPPANPCPIRVSADLVKFGHRGAHVLGKSRPRETLAV